MLFEIRKVNKSKSAFFQFEKLIEVRVGGSWPQANKPQAHDCGAMRDQ